MIVTGTAVLLLVIAMFNQRFTSKPFGEANKHLSKANLHLDSMSRNSQIINALAMIPEAVQIWGKDTAASLRAPDPGAGSQHSHGISVQGGSAAHTGRHSRAGELIWRSRARLQAAW